VTLFAFKVIKDTLNEMAAVFQIVYFRDYKDVVLWIRRSFRVNIIGDLTSTVDGVLVVTTKENIL